jgi:nicotinamidase-related amidase
MRMKDPSKPEIKPIEPKPVVLDAEKTALLVLELCQRLANPEYFGAHLIPGVTRLLERARASGVLTAFTIPETTKGTPEGQVYAGFNRRPTEPVFLPSAFDKFNGGQLQTFLSLHEVKTVIITGIKANMSILYTATTAATQYNYDVIIPVDGIFALTDYEIEYTLYQFRAFPAGFPKRFTFTRLDMIDFK